MTRKKKTIKGYFNPKVIYGSIGGVVTAVVVAITPVIDQTCGGWSSLGKALAPVVAGAIIAWWKDQGTWTPP